MPKEATENESPRVRKVLPLQARRENCRGMLRVRMRIFKNKTQNTHLPRYNNALQLGEPMFLTQWLAFKMLKSVMGFLLYCSPIYRKMDTFIQLAFNRMEYLSSLKFAFLFVKFSVPHLFLVPRFGCHFTNRNRKNCILSIAHFIFSRITSIQLEESFGYEGSHTRSNT